MGGNPADDEAFSVGLTAAPNGVGALLAIGGKLEDDAAFSAGFDAPPNGTGAALDIGGKPAAPESLSAGFTSLVDFFDAVPGFGGKLKEDSGLLSSFVSASLLLAPNERFPKFKPVEDELLPLEEEEPNPPKPNDGALVVVTIK